MLPHLEACLLNRVMKKETRQCNAMGASWKTECIGQYGRGSGIEDISWGQLEGCKLLQQLGKRADSHLFMHRIVLLAWIDDPRAFELRELAFAHGMVQEYKNLSDAPRGW
jgi:hypothetical protein